MRHTLEIGRLFDIRIGVHVSWLVVFVLMVISIAASIENTPRGVALALAVCSALLLFGSVLAHEIAHALVARRYGVRTRGITLFLFGGIAMLESEAPTPSAEVMIALAGPAMSAALGATALAALVALERFPGVPDRAAAGLVVAYVALANGVLAAFNLVPAYPMDGGRVLRAAIWRARRSRPAATGAASIVGIGLAAVLAAYGLTGMLALHAWRDGWYVLVGAFVARAGWSQLRESRLQERLEHVRVGDVMEAAAEDDVPLEDFSLAPSASALDAVSAFRNSGRAQIAVIDAGRLAGWLRRERTLAIADRAA